MDPLSPQHTPVTRRRSQAALSLAGL